MAWLEISTQIDKEHANLMSEVMSAQGALAVTFSALDQQEIFQEEVGQIQYWRKTLMKALFEESEEAEVILRQVRLSFAYFDSLDYQCSIIEDQDWVRLTQQQFQPILIDERFWVCPSWQELDDERLQIKLDPGLAFGTGTHPTTRLCLSWLAQNSVVGKTIIDYGCGSGVLALAALGVGAKKVYAIDHDVQAVEATKNNAHLNRCKLGEALVPMLDEDLPVIKVPCILANILAKPLCQLVDVFWNLLAESGCVVLSGIQRDHIEKIRQHYEEKFVEIDLAFSEEWVRMVWVKR